MTRASNGENGTVTPSSKNGSDRKNGRYTLGPKKRNDWKFAHPWQEIEERYLEFLDAFYGDEDYDKAETQAQILIKLLRRHDRDEQSILGQEIRSLAHELHEEWRTAIRHRLREIELIGQLWKHAAAADAKKKALLLEGYEPLDLADRYDLLAMLYYEDGQLKKAIEALWQAREICEEHGVQFDSGDLLAEYLQEWRATPPPSKRK